jgi:hypothetical protein
LLGMHSLPLLLLVRWAAPDGGRRLHRTAAGCRQARRTRTNSRASGHNINYVCAFCSRLWLYMQLGCKHTRLLLLPDYSWLLKGPLQQRRQSNPRNIERPVDLLHVPCLPHSPGLLLPPCLLPVLPCRPCAPLAGCARCVTGSQAPTRSARY